MTNRFAIISFLILAVFSRSEAQQFPLFVSPSGNDSNSGTILKPYRTIQAALKSSNNFPQKSVDIVLRKGTYYLDTVLLITSPGLHTHSLSIRAYANESVIISGAKRINPEWTTYTDKIRVAFIGKEQKLDQLYCNGKVMHMARYPNYDSTSRVFNGTAADAISKERIKGWHDPTGGFVHALHQGEWGDFHYRILSADSNGELKLEGGWQNNRPAPMHRQYRFVENIFEELDAPGEWYYNASEGKLYVYPRADKDLTHAIWEVSVLDGLIVIKGNAAEPVRNIAISGIRFTGTNRTFMQTKEPIVRSDWTIYRGGAILIDGAEHIKIKDCHFEELGGNAVFVSNYNRDIDIEGNEIDQIGASAIAFVGSADAVRSPSFKYEEFVAMDKMDFQPGPKTADYPKRCRVFNNLIHNIGNIEKQVAGVEIDLSSEITVSHNTIYNVPRSGINIGDGCWGGHTIEYNDVFNTVLETGDHGAFNSWARDRFWLPDIKSVDSLVAEHPELPFLDAIEPIVLRNNRFYCNHGWDIDLDDGSTNYRIYNNVCLNGGLKLREGFNRIVENNILINNSFHPHVWYKDGKDVFRHNIVSADYAPIGIKIWGKQVDSNFFLLKTSLQRAHENGTDAHSLYGDPHFADPTHSNYTVLKNAPALQTGFKNFPMDSFGVTSPSLKRKAVKAPVPSAYILQPAKKGETFEWFGATFKNIESLGERSAAGLFDESGILMISIPADSRAAKNNLREGDVIRTVNGKQVSNVSEFLGAIQLVNWQGRARIGIIRNQKEQTINLSLQ